MLVALLLLFLLLLLCLSQEIAVVTRILVVRVDLEHFFVGVDRAIELALARQRVAEVVEAARIFQLREAAGALPVISGAILCHGAPRRIVEQCGRIVRLTGVQLPLRLLVLRKPEIVP